MRVRHLFLRHHPIALDRVTPYDWSVRPWVIWAPLVVAAVLVALW